jgi:hypothetical protein
MICGKIREEIKKFERRIEIRSKSEQSVERAVFILECDPA